MLDFVSKLQPDLTYSRHNVITGAKIPHYDAYACTETSRLVISEFFNLLREHADPESLRLFEQIFEMPTSFSGKHPTTQLLAHALATSVMTRSSLKASTFLDETQHILGALHHVPGYPNFADKAEHYLEIFRLMLDWPTDKPHISIEAETQWGKTILIMVALMLIKGYLYASLYKSRRRGEPDQRKEMIVLVTMNRNTITDVTTRDYNGCLEILGDIAIKLGDGLRVPLYEAVNSVDLEQGRNVPVKRGGVRAEQKAKGILKRTTISNFEEHLERAKQGSYTHVTMMVDEADSAVATRSILSRVIKMFSDAGIKLRFVAISATPKMYSDLETFRRYRIVVKDNNYSGLFQGTRTPIYSTDRFCELAGIDPNLSEIKLLGKVMKAVLHGVKDPKPQYPQFPHARLNGKPFNGGNGMMIRCDRTSDIDAILSAHGDWLQRKDIVVLRYYTKFFKAQTVEINGQPVELNGYHNQSSLIEQAMSQGAKWFLLFMVDSGRRGDRIPPECTANIDLTQRFTTETAGEQGTIGRITGHGKTTPDRCSFVLLSDRNKMWTDCVRYLYDENPEKAKLSVMKVAHATITDVCARATKRKMANFDADDPAIAPLVARIRKMVLPWVTTRRNDPNKKRTDPTKKGVYAPYTITYRRFFKDDSKIFVNFRPSGRRDARDHVHRGTKTSAHTPSSWFFPLLDDKMADHLDQVTHGRYQGVKILRPGQWTTGEKPMPLACHPVHSEYVQVSINNFERGQRPNEQISSGGGRQKVTPSARYIRENGPAIRATDRESEVLLISLAFIIDHTGGVTLRQITLPLQSEVVVMPDWRTIAKQMTFPTDANLYSGPLFMNEVDRATRDAMIAAKKPRYRL